MSEPQWTEQEEWQLAEFLIREVCDRAAGRRGDECLRNYPRDVYFIGSLRPKPSEEDLGQAELLNKLAPVAFGAEFRLQPQAKEMEVTIKLNWACYYRVFPTLDQQRQHQQLQVAQVSDVTVTEEAAQEFNAEQYTEELADTLGELEPIEDDAEISAIEEEQEMRQAEGESPEVVESASDRRRARTPKDSLFIRFRKVQCQAQGRVALRLNTPGVWETDVSELQAALDHEVALAQEVAMRDPERIRTDGSPHTQVRIPETDLASEAAYNAFLTSLKTDVVPEWKWKVNAKVWPDENPEACVVLLEFVNVSPMPERSPNTEAFLFDTHATFVFSGSKVLPFELEVAPRGFRYDRYIWGRGFNCAVERIADAPQMFTTTHTPIYRQMRYQTRTTPAATFKDLAQNPIPILEDILSAMEAYRQEWIRARQHYIAADPTWEAKFGPEFDRDQQQFEQEIERFRRGYQLVRDNDDVRLAFQLTNETFLRGDPRKTGWRLFQIVFLVSQIPGIFALAGRDGVDISEREFVDIIYFPTGGGKTEAYLAVMVFHCFFDRLRGKRAGVTAWTRFPLRLLTLQQTQRVADVIGIAELVRRQQSDPRLNGPDVDGFAVGYFVGAEATPNEITPPRPGEPPDPIWSQANDPDARQRWKRVMRCPACRTTTVQVDFDPATVRVIHRCTQPSCSFPDGVIPVYVVDNEIYRYLPSIIVGTIDKLAGLGNQRKLAQVFGQVDGRCTQHGYYKGRCCQKECRDTTRLRRCAIPGLSGPTLFVQDELHLLKEGLGTFDAHYETFTQRLLQEFGHTEPLKIIASSATIEAFERQVEHLYGRSPREARIFPSPGPTLGKSFYAETLNYPQRLFVGIIPHNKTIFNTILELIDIYHRELQRLQSLPLGAPNPYSGTLVPGTAEWQTLLDFYATSLTYFLTNRELNSIRTDIEGEVNPNLLRDRLLPLETPELTGSTSTDEVTRILERLERPLPPGKPPNAVLATSMVSHGVDVDRFNVMIFYGMPRQNAEYIQASSRVGRAHVGIVFTCLHPVRERDQSHYAYFLKYHEFLGQLVEPVAINRWSKFSINRTLPGLFMGVLLQLIANRSGESNPNRYYVLDFVKKKISEGSLRTDDFIPFLEEAYRVQAARTASEAAFRDELGLRVGQFIDQILGAGSGRTFVSDALIPGPMRSLRDVDEAIEIELDNLGSQWASRTIR